MKNGLWIVLLVCALLAFAAPVLAQTDATPEPVVVEATAPAPVTSIEISGDGPVTIGQSPAEPAPVEEPRPLFDTNSVLTLIVAISGSILVGGGGLMVINRLLKRRDVQDLVEAKFIAAPAPTQETVLQVVAMLDKVTDLLRDTQAFLHVVTDKKPNDTPQG